MKTIINAVLFSFLISMASSSFAENYYGADEQASDSEMIVDLFLARPLGLVGSVFGGAVHIVGLLFSIPGENAGEASEVLLEDPLNYTFNRPLGHFNDESY